MSRINKIKGKDNNEPKSPTMSFRLSLSEYEVMMNEYEAYTEEHGTIDFSTYLYNQVLKPWIKSKSKQALKQTKKTLHEIDRAALRVVTNISVF